MPKRSNKFQKLIHLIHTQLTDCKVIESALFVDDRSGEEREVDIAIISEIAGYPVIIGIECRDHSRPQSTGWVEEMWAKHQALPTSSLILVSSSGFYRPALKAARRLKIEALKLQDATETNWPEFLPKLHMLAVEEIWITPIRCTIIPDELWFPEGMKQEVLSELVVYDPDGKHLGTLKQIFDNARDSIKIEPNPPAEIKNATGYLHGKVRFSKGTYLLDTKGQQRSLREMHFRLRFDRFVSQADLRQYQFREKFVTVSDSSNKFAEIIYTVVTSKDQQFSAGATISQLKELPPACIWDIAIPSEFTTDQMKHSIPGLDYSDQTQFVTSGKPSPEPPKLSLDLEIIKLPPDFELPQNSEAASSDETPT